MWATMKYVSWMKMSTGVEAMKMPESPPITNMDTNASALSIGTVNWIRPPQRVPSQLNVLMADGTAMTIVETRNAMPIIENAIAWYPKIGFRAKTGRISEAMPIAGRIRM